VIEDSALDKFDLFECQIHSFQVSGEALPGKAMPCFVKDQSSPAVWVFTIFTYFPFEDIFL
jgi:hypothetical protein